MRTKAIWEFPLSLKAPGEEVMIPCGAELLTVQLQDEVPCLWALVDPESKPVSRRVRIYGTGHPVQHEGQYVGTFQLHGGTLIFHVFVGEENWG